MGCRCTKRRSEEDPDDWQSDISRQKWFEDRHTTHHMLSLLPKEEQGEGEQRPPRGPYYILAFDGGGAKGMLEATLLWRLCDQLPGLLDKVDMIVGTSTGSIIAAYLAKGFKPDFVMQKCAENGMELEKTRNRRGISGMFGPKFSQATFRMLLGKDLGDDWTFQDVQKHLVITSVSVSDQSVSNQDSNFRGMTMTNTSSIGTTATIGSLFQGKSGQTPSAFTSRDLQACWLPKVFHNLPRSSSKKTSIVDAVMASAAAPTVFPTHQGCTDGGIAANNPSMVAVSMAFRTLQRDLHDVRVFSIGGGMYPGEMKHKPLTGGFFDWGPSLISCLIDMTTVMPEFYASSLLGDNIFRLQTKFPHEVDAFDMRPQNMDMFKEFGMAADLGPAVAWLERKWGLQRGPVPVLEPDDDPRCI